MLKFATGMVVILLYKYFNIIMIDFTKSFDWLPQEILRKEVGMLRNPVPGINYSCKTRTQKLFKEIFILPDILRQFKLGKKGSIKGIQKGKNKSILIIIIKILEIAYQSNNQKLLIVLKKYAYNQENKILDLMPIENDIKYTEASLKKILVEFFHLVKPNQSSKNIVNFFNKYPVLQNIFVSLFRIILYSNGLYQAHNIYHQFDTKLVILLLSKALEFQYKEFGDGKIFLFDNDHYLAEDQNTIYFNCIAQSVNEIEELDSQDSFQKDENNEKQQNSYSSSHMRSFSQVQLSQQMKNRQTMRQNIYVFSPQITKTTELEDKKIPYNLKYFQSQTNSPQKQYFNRFSEDVNPKVPIQKINIRKTDNLEVFFKKAEQVPFEHRATSSSNNLVNNKSTPMINLNRTNSINQKVNYISNQQQVQSKLEQPKYLSKPSNIVFNNNVKIFRPNQNQKPMTSYQYPSIKNNMISTNQEISEKKYQELNQSSTNLIKQISNPPSGNRLVLGTTTTLISKKSNK